MRTHGRRSTMLFFTYFPFWSHEVRRSAGFRVSIEIAADFLAEHTNFVDLAKANGTSSGNRSPAWHDWMPQNYTFPVPGDNLHISSTQTFSNAVSNSSKLETASTTNSTNLESQAVPVKSGNLGFVAQAVLAQTSEAHHMIHSQHDFSRALPLSEVAIRNNLSSCIAKKLGIKNDGVCPSSIGCEVGCSCGFGLRCYVKEFRLNQGITASCPDEVIEEFEDTDVNIGACNWSISVLVLVSILCFLACFISLMMVKACFQSFRSSDD